MGGRSSNKLPLSTIILPCMPEPDWGGARTHDDAEARDDQRYLDLQVDGRVDNGHCDQHKIGGGRSRLLRWLFVGYITRACTAQNYGGRGCLHPNGNQTTSIIQPAAACCRGDYWHCRVPSSSSQAVHTDEWNAVWLSQCSHGILSCKHNQGEGGHRVKCPSQCVCVQSIRIDAVAAMLNASSDPLQLPATQKPAKHNTSRARPLASRWRGADAPPSLQCRIWYLVFMHSVLGGDQVVLLADLHVRRGLLREEGEVGALILLGGYRGRKRGAKR